MGARGRMITRKTRKTKGKNGDEQRGEEQQPMKGAGGYLYEGGAGGYLYEGATYLYGCLPRCGIHGSL